MKKTNIKTEYQKKKNIFSDIFAFDTKYYSSGFTLVEMLVAVFVMSMAVVGMIVVSSSGVVNLRYLKDKTSATMLASEGIEMVHNLRDSFVINPDSGGWDGFVSTVSGCEEGCVFDPLYPGIVSSCSPTPDYPCQKMKILNGSFTYGATGAGDSKFTRYITISPILGSDDELVINSTVFWNEGNKEYSVVLESSLMNWLDSAPVL